MDKNSITYFAETDARNKRVKFGIKTEDRLRHIYLIGKTGMGKSTLLENMAIQDIQNGEGVAFLDPHGSTADKFLDYVPEDRIKDVIYFAPFDIEHPIAFNVMEDVGPERRHLVVSGLMSAFEKLFGEESFSDRMQYILQNTILALLEYPGATMLGINRMLSDKTYRNAVIANITDPSVKNYWTKEYAGYTERFAAEAIPAIQNKIGQFTSNPLIRNIIGQPKSSFDIRKIMDEKKILIVNLSKGLVGENNANLLGSMLVTKIYLAAMSRADANPQELKKLPNFYLYVDEFQSFANKSFADILSEARKYKLGLNIAHQYIEQMADEVRAAVFGNVGTMIAYRVGSYDAEVLEKEFAPVFTMEDIVNLGLYQMYLKLMIDGVASQPFSAVGLPPWPKPEISFRQQVTEMSRQNYTKPKVEVEKAIEEWHSSEQNSQASNNKFQISKKTEGTKEINIEKPKINFIKESVVPKEKGLNLGEAIQKAIKQKEAVNSQQPVFREEKYNSNKSLQDNKPQVISLNNLKKSEKNIEKNNNQKEPTPEHKNALKEALGKIQNQKAEEKIKEIPEETLRKVLKGE